jgi:class 3 adenylate cyclase
MEPRVQYVTTGDGTRIAFAVVGSGPPLVEIPPIPFCHFQRSWQFPEERRWFQRLACSFTLINHDPRGMGLSTRVAAEYSGEAMARDLDAVLDRVGVARVALLASFTSGPLAIHYAASRPERVSHLILWVTASRLSDLWPPQMERILELIETDWELFTETTTHIYRGWAAGERAHRQAIFFRECVTPAVMRELIAVGRASDVTDVLADVRAPTLVVHRGRLPWLPVERAQELAARIPDARLVLQPEEPMPPFVGDLDGAARVIEEFVGVASPEPPAAPETGAGSGLRTILFTDVVDSTSLTARLGDVRAREILRAHEHTVREAVRVHGGAEVKALGDGFLLSFGSAARALACAVEIQRRTRRLNEALHVRIGVNAGEPLAEDGDLFGTAVNLAARIAAVAEPDSVLVSDVVRQLVAGKRLEFASRGEVTLRGFQQPVALYELRWAEGVAG